MPEINISISITIDGTTYEGSVDDQELFIADLLVAHSLNKDPVEAMVFLANRGSKYIICNIPDVTIGNKLRA